MHEVDMTRCLLLSMEEWKQQLGSDASPCVSTVHLQVGTFTCVEPASLVFTFAAATQGTWLDGAVLAVESIPLKARCLPCGQTYDPEPSQAYRSPCCHHPMEEILSGRELKIRSIDYTLPPIQPSQPRSEHHAHAPSGHPRPQPAGRQPASGRPQP